MSSRRFFVTSNGAVYDAIQAADNGFLNAFHAYQVPSFGLLPSGCLIVCFVHVSVCASAQLEMHKPENTNTIADVRAFMCI